MIRLSQPEMRQSPVARGIMHDQINRSSVNLRTPINRS